jgi:hypothetical protein
MESFMFRSFARELSKLAQGGLMPFIAQKALPFAKQYAKPAALVAAGGVGVLGAQRLIENQRMAEQMRAMQRGG